MLTFQRPEMSRTKTKAMTRTSWTNRWVTLAKVAPTRWTNRCGGVTVKMKRFDDITVGLFRFIFDGVSSIASIFRRKARRRKRRDPASVRRDSPSLQPRMMTSHSRKTRRRTKTRS